MRKCERKSPSDTKVSEEGGGGGGAPGTWAEIPLQPIVKTTVMQAVPLQSVEDPMLEQVDVPWRKLQPTENPY